VDAINLGIRVSGNAERTHHATSCNEVLSRDRWGGRERERDERTRCPATSSHTGWLAHLLEPNQPTGSLEAGPLGYGHSGSGRVATTPTIRPNVAVRVMFVGIEGRKLICMHSAATRFTFPHLYSIFETIVYKFTA
jgi:hypothetical protein